MRNLVAISILLGLSACGGKIETRVSSAGQQNFGKLSYRFAKSSGPENSDLKNARQLLVKALAANQIINAKSAPVLLQVTLSQRPAKLGLHKGREEKMSVISVPKEKKAFQSCEDKEYRLGIRFSKISDGAMLYSGDVAEYHCKATISESLPAMVRAIVSDLDEPRGEKLFSRGGKE